MRDLVQVHADRRLDVKIDADAATDAGLGYFEVPAQVGRDEVGSECYPARLIRQLGDGCKNV